MPKKFREKEAGKVNELVSVIMSTYNEEPDWVKGSIESILNQTYSQLEFIIIIDNPKNKLLKELINEYQEKDNRIKVFPNEVNKGLVESLNIALGHCSGTYIARMDADDVSEPDRLSLEKEFLEEHNLDFVFSGMSVIDEHGNLQYEFPIEELNGEEVRRRMSRGNISTHPTWFVKSEVYQSLDGYRNIPYCEDFDFSLRALSRGFKIGKVKANLLRYRVRDSGISKSYEFEQFMNTRKILELYKRNQLNDISLVQKELEQLNNEYLQPESKAKYMEAAQIFDQGKSLIKKGSYLKGIVHLIRSNFLSKYYTLKVLKTYLNK
jgi:GT2 family glycosyltransferase